MTSVFWFSLVLGGGFILLSFVGDALDIDVDDAGADLETADATRFLSIRNLTYFLFAFGAVGATLSWLWRGERLIVATLTAALVGLVAAILAGLAFDFVRRNEAGEREGEDSFIGLTGRITLPIGADHAGRVMVRRGEREYELRARAFDPEAPRPANGSTIVVVAMDDGTALVSPIDSHVS